MQPFDPHTIDLHGQQLIEASAGTGKTFSIAILYLRLVLERKLEVDQILVVTFTRSATDELRERIRSRLREALDVLEQAGSGDIHCVDSMLSSLLERLPDRNEAKQRLADSMARMDESAIYTIHGFCQRMLHDNAFESNAHLDVELVESEQELRREILRDFWRRNFYGASEQEALWAAKKWKGPEGLAAILDPLVAKAGFRFLPDVSGQDLVHYRAELAQSWQRVIDCWAQGEEKIREILHTDKCLKRTKNDYGDEGLAKILSWLEGVVADGAAPWHLPREATFLAASVMGATLKGKKIPPEHHFFELFDDYFQQQELAGVLVLQSAFRFLGEELASRKLDRAQMHFNDLLTSMVKALDSPGRQRLIRKVRGRFNVALVDEFQDTDVLQYTIFSNIFGQGPGPGLFMIGDPKQAIYSFRGADVFAYIRAKHETQAANRYTMDTNYRSTAAMVNAVNRVFDQPGSFVFDEDITFGPVKSAGHAEAKPLKVNGKQPRPLQVKFLDVDTYATPGQKDIAKGNASEGAARWCAQEIAHLLELGEKGRAQIGDRGLSGGDIAVLVRSHQEAEQVQRELARLWIASVYYSQNSVFTSQEAWELYQVLLALLDLSNGSQVRTALATGLFGKDAGFMEQLRSDTSAWDDVIAQLGEYQLYWRTQGVAAMLHKLMVTQHVVQRLITVTGGERKLTNYLHLAELLQSASELMSGEDRLVRWLNIQCLDPEKADSSQQLRLESDENLVRIVTIHKAKGLEYPVVFLPFVWNGRTVKKDDIWYFHLLGTSEPAADLGTGDQNNYQLAEQERLAEDFRLLYVALTRAIYCCYFAWGRVKSMDNSALARLVHGEGSCRKIQLKELSDAKIREDLEVLVEEGLLEIGDGQEGVIQQKMPVAARAENLSAKIFEGQIDTGWSISSYSRLVRGTAHVTQSGEVELGQSLQFSGTPGQDIFSFPKGAAAGTCLHTIFERIDFSNFSTEELNTVVEDELQRNGLDRQWNSLVVKWVTDVLASPLMPDDTLRLDSLPPDKRLVEMEFYFSMHSFDTAAFNTILADFGFGPVDMQTSELRGLMKGFIDLVFAHNGRYFLADYKSNYLGRDAADYQPAKLKNAMREHRYDLQYLVYSVALHRYLRSRLSSYTYTEHFGGVYYLYLRGMQPAFAPGNGVYYTVPDQELIERLDGYFGCQESI